MCVHLYGVSKRSLWLTGVAPSELSARALHLTICIVRLLKIATLSRCLPPNIVHLFAYSSFAFGCSIFMETCGESLGCNQTGINTAACALQLLFVSMMTESFLKSMLLLCSVGVGLTYCLK